MSRLLFKLIFIAGLLAGSTTTFAQNCLRFGGYRLTAPQVRQIKVDTNKRKILLIGDSMADGLFAPLSELARKNNHQLWRATKASSTIIYWCGNDSLSYVIDSIKPDYVLICLGSNELQTKNLDRYASLYIDCVDQQAGSLPRLWIGPPSWTRDNGLNDLLMLKVGEKRFFRSENLDFERTTDKKHPTIEGFKKWTDTLAYWINWESKHKIRLYN